MARSVLLKLTADPSDARRGIDQVEDDIKGLGRLTQDARVDIKTEAAKAKLDKLHTQLRRLGSQESTPEVKIRTARVVSQIERIENELDRAVGKPRRMRIIGGASGLPGGAGAFAGAKGAAVGAAGAAASLTGAAVVAGLFGAGKAAIEAEVSLEKLKTQLAASGKSYDQYGKQIDTVIQKQSTLSGLDDEDLQDSFTNILRVTGDVTKSLRLNGLAADFARAKHIDVAKAGEIVAKVAGGNTGILSRYGIQIEKGASSTEALGTLQKKFAGQAEAYGKTTQGSLDRTSVAFENLGEVVGAELTPVIRALAEFIPKIPPALREAVKAIKNFGGTRQIFKGLGQSIKGLVQLVGALFRGDWSEVWRGFKNIVSGNIKTAIGYLRNMVEPFRRVGKRIGGAIAGGIRSGVEGVVGFVRGLINKVIDAFNGIIAGINVVADKDPTGIVPHIDKLDHVGPRRDLFKGVKGNIPGTVVEKKPRIGARAASVINVAVSTPGGGSPDPRVLADQLGREIRRRGG